MVNQNDETAGKIAVILTQNNNLFKTLEGALDNMFVVRAKNIEDVNGAVKTNTVSAIVLHVINSSGWIISDLLRTGYPDIPRFFILSRSVANETSDYDELAKKHEAAAIISEGDDEKKLAPLIVSGIAKRKVEEISSKERFVKALAELMEEFLRLQKELNIFSFRTLPQPAIGEDTQMRLDTILKQFKEIKIKP